MTLPFALFQPSFHVSLVSSVHLVSLVVKTRKTEETMILNVRAVQEFKGFRLSLKI